MRFDIITIFPDFFRGPFDHGVLRRAIAAGIVEVATHDLRRFTTDKHRTVDDRPFGGGEGMVLKPEPLVAAVESLALSEKPARTQSRECVVLLSAQGRRFTQAVAHQLAAMDRIVFLCGRYEGVDERVAELVVDLELSIGDYVLSGGELAAAVVIDTVARLLPGVLGNQDSARFESFGIAEGELAATANPAESPRTPPRSTHGSGGLLDYPHYTRPPLFRGLAVPEVLANGDHSQIRAWRRQRALEKTFRNRPDLLEQAELSREDREFLKKLEHDVS